MNSYFVLEYIWLGANNILRSKTKIWTPGEDEQLYMKKHGITAGAFPIWNFDGSSTGQASGTHSEIKIQPVAVYSNPFYNNRTYQNYLVLCQTLDKDNIPLVTNTRVVANEIFEQTKDQKPWFGIEQEYFIISDAAKNGVHYLDRDENHNPIQFKNYCGTGYTNIFHREMVIEHMHLCLNAGLNISGVNAEVAPGQWEYQIGPCEGIKAGDQLWISRWIMERLTERYKVRIDWSPKPYEYLNGSGCHTNFSTRYMRESGGINTIYSAIEKLRHKHDEHMKIYGEDNDKRMSGLYETAQYDKFSFNPMQPVDRGASVRVGYETIANRCGYFEDRRPASNMDPYLVTSKLVYTICM